MATTSDVLGRASSRTFAVLVSVARTHRGRAGPLIRERRQAAGRSLLDVATDVGVSTRHLGFVELGRSRPSPELLALIADRLGVPPRDRCFTAQLWNESAVWLADGIPTEGRGDPTNMFHVSLHPDGFARRTRNFEEWSRHLLHQLDLIVRRTRAPEAIDLAARIETWPGIAPRETWSRWLAPVGDPVLPWIVEHGGVELSMFSVMATLGTPVDLTLSELTIELFLPADDATATHLRRRR